MGAKRARHAAAQMTEQVELGYACVLHAYDQEGKPQCHMTQITHSHAHVAAEPGKLEAIAQQIRAQLESID